MNVQDFNTAVADDKELVGLLATYSEIEAYYRQVLSAMYVGEPPVEPVRNSAEVTLSLDHESSATIEVR
jgi:hypothetical protein